MKINFSVVIPLYNKEKYIRNTIASVLSQSHQDFELIVVDDGSTDQSADLVKSISDPRIKIISQKNAGVSVARNTGILSASYPYVALLDGDDIWAREHLEKLARLINDYPDAGLYCMGYQFIEPDGSVKNPLWHGVESRGSIARYFQASARGDLIPTSSSVCVPKHVFDEVGMFPAGENLGEDQDMWGRIAMRYAVVADPAPTAIYLRAGDGNRICISGDFGHESPYLKRLQNLLDTGKVAKDQSEDIKEYIRKGLFTLISMNLRKGDRAAAKVFLNDPRISMKSIRYFKWRLIYSLPVPVSRIVFDVSNANADRERLKMEVPRYN